MKPKHKTLPFLGKLEDYPPHQIENIAKKLLKLSEFNMGNIVAGSFHTLSRINYVYVLIIKKIWDLFKMNEFTLIIKQNHKTQFDWMQVLQLMIAER
ncbi:MAG: hypothetical protein ACLFVR_12345, partial [Thiohalospira sp.]